MPYPDWVHRKVAEIESYIKRTCPDLSKWYCGIAADPLGRLSIDHNVHTHCVHRNFGSDRVARDVESYFHNLGCQGSYGGGSDNTTHVYCYFITRDTVE